MADTISTEDYYRADISTKKHPDELGAWWFKNWVRLYNAFKVRFESRTTDLQQKKDLLTFRFARNEALGPFYVDLKDDYRFVWSDLPSTIQFATKDAPYGFLLLSPEWVATQSQTVGTNLGAFAEGGGKWPIGAGEKSLREFIMERVHDKQRQDDLLELLDLLLK
ncbi:hypothetical protein D7Y27_13640 [Corallococcus sp. AB004]|uniref:hypothetical protein n=1 Tax=Corallococcus TaxID=83461 RepID=UPI000EA3D300|nr:MULTISPECIES: hypothetical protein [Corallococcus]NPC45934.1 hypothetical protein [Corallococcus exiguus]NRD44928.1 hypothetical protein [Corallococcus exiguus]RKI44488.1 hypothetical protein D7Y27_13640 [Corallococcus sp. AB004]